MKDVQIRQKNISDLLRKEMCVRFNSRELTEKQKNEIYKV